MNAAQNCGLSIVKHMKKVFIYIFLVALIIGNIYTFVSGIELASEISYFEKESKTLHQENIELERKATAINSFQNAASLAASLDFVKQAAPVYLNNLPQALNR